MRELLARLASEKSIHVSVVTFSSQPDMVRTVVESVLDTPEPEDTVAGNNTRTCAAHPITVRALDGSWKPPNAIHRGERWWDDTMQDEQDEGKQAHMVSAIQELEFLFFGNLQITKSTSVLIDDDPDNIQIAKDNGVRALWLDPDHPETLFSDLCELT